ncbi:MAG: aminopeptidase, partial [Bacteroidetes bacterium]|nr:aminopeptidase [Bacteroidota bacterium]
MKKSTTLFILTICLTYLSKAQDREFAVKMVDTLCAETFWGRGYTKDGMHKAALFLASKFDEFGVKPMSGKTFFQEYSYSVNTFPDKMSLSVDGVVLQAGKDFIVAAESKGVTAMGTLKQVDSVQFVDVTHKVIVKLK